MIITERVGKEKILLGAEGIEPSTSILPLRQVAEEATTILGVGGLEPPASSLPRPTSP